MDKQIVLLAEQVGIFLIPTIKAAVESRVLKSQSSLFDRILALSQEVESSKSAAAIERASMEALTEAIRVSISNLREAFAAQLEEAKRELSQTSSAGLAKVEGDFKTATKTSEQLYELIGKAQSSADRLAESVAIRAGQITSLKADIDTVREEVLARVDSVSGGALTAVAGLRSDLESLQKTVGELPPPQVVNNTVEAPSLESVVAALEPTIAKHVDAAAASIKPAAPLPAIEPDPAAIADAVAAAVKAVELPAIDYAAVDKSLASMVRQAVQALPPVPPLPAIEPDPAAIADAVAAAVKAIELPTINYADVDKSLALMVNRAVQALPPVLPLPAIEPDPAAIADAVAAAVKSIELPTIDKEAIDNELIRLVDEKFDQAVPAVQSALARNVHDEVARAVALLPVPEKGLDGKDGLMPLVEPYVEGYVYERGMAATYGGGTWQATRRTKAAPAPGAADWQALAVGVAGLALAVGADGRTVELKASLSDGAAAEASVKLPTMVYRGVYDEAIEYDVGDSITFKGAVWTAKTLLKGVRPAEDVGGWQLSVKAGRDGKGGKDGADGVQFQAGYVGEYEQNKVYSKNSIVSYATSLWLAKRPTKEIPPYMSMQDNEHWLRLR